MELLELEVGAPAAGGAMVARAPDGRVVFVRHALPGEVVRAQVTQQTAHYLRADAVQVLAASPDRVVPPCPYAGPARCGGCDFQHAALPAQRTLKARLVAEQLRRVARLEREVVVEPLPGDDGGLGWRTRVTYSVDRDGRPGLHRHRSDALEHVAACLIAAPGVAAVGAQQLAWPGARAVEVATTADGAQRAVAVTGRLREVPAVPAGVVVDGRPLVAPHGLRHVVAGRAFEVAAGGFWQGHVGLPARLVDLVLSALQPRPGERAVDLYAGAGLFAALLGERVGRTGSVLAVEADPRACADCARNTGDLPQVRVRTAAVDAALVARLDVDLVVLDPPRTGLGVPAARALAALRPRAVAYVSCDAASFSRDLRVLLEAGWSLAGLTVLDAYPMTEHVELVGTLHPPGMPGAPSAG